MDEYRQQPRFDADAAANRQVQTLLHSAAVRTERGAILVSGELVHYCLYAVDARTLKQQAADEQRGRPSGSVIVVVPGHGQTATGPRKLVATAALLSRAKIAWCIDPVPSRGGDLTEAQAIAAVTRHHLTALYPGAIPPPPATLLGWSHGGGEALRAAAAAPDLFPYYIGLCPAGFAERQPLEMVRSFGLEAARILARSLRRRRWSYAADTLRLGADLAVGIVADLRQSRSLHTVVEDVTWACRKVPGTEFSYPGHVVLLWGGLDSVVRWRDVLTDCDTPESIPDHLPGYVQCNLPHACQVESWVLDGDHLGPEANAPSFVRLGLRIVGELDETAIA